jgi:type I restriction enzyme, S subunit
MKKYEAYKDSGVEWIGEIPEHWNSILFKRVIQRIKDGTHGTFQRVENGKPFLSAKNVYDWGLELSDIESQISEEDFSEITKNGFPYKNDLLVTCVGTIGRAYVYDLDYPMAFQRSVAFLRLDTRIAIPKFYKYYIQSSLYQDFLKSIAKTSAQSGVYMGDLMNSISILVPIEEQECIFRFLDRKTAQLDTLISKKEKLIELLEEERTGIINHAVTKGINPDVPMKDSGIEWLGEMPAHWEVKRLKHVANINPTKSIVNYDKFSEEEVVFLPMEKVSEDGSINQELKRKISDVSSGFTYFEKDDIIIAKITPCFENGKGALLNGLLTPFGFGSTEFHTIRSTNELSKEFIFFIAKSERFMTIGEAFMTGAAGQKRVPTSFIENFTIGVPPMAEQMDITKYIESQNLKINDIVIKTKKEVELLTEYKTSLISEVVTGKIDVRDEILN